MEVIRRHGPREAYLAGAELHKLTKEEVERIFVPGQKQAIADKEPGAHAVTAPEDAQQVEETQRKFAANKKGQFDLGSDWNAEGRLLVTDRQVSC
jgi:hypothetical protein